MKYPITDKINPTDKVFFHQMKRSLLDEDDCIKAVQYSDILLTTIISCPIYLSSADNMISSFHD